MASFGGLGHYHAHCMGQANRLLSVCLLPNRRSEASSGLHTAYRICHSLGQWGSWAMDQPEAGSWLGHGVIS